ncbi:ribosome-associated ATPase/putative transporter RbbA [Dongia rigui]|uniref:Ribosome-associated ATPase/putative transporter RbbA n=1 Tax=Dongia rigui TaxID=940149 RepID=A0ABU5E2Y0_9PROT|nr:ribosome-associated ATPase/putative transporter RbbA [Dongia rigui]MDY0873930.1 ribosome-associated ATPase/putative transporter RbbA [Dongia rigui]
MSEAGAGPVLPAVRLTGLQHRNNRHFALHDMSFDIAPGSTAALIGPDGVGKSTLLSLIAGTRRIQQGEVSVLGGDMASRRHRNRIAERIAYMPQGLGKNLYPTLSVTENIDFFAGLFGLHGNAAKDRRARLLRATGLDPFPDRPAGKLSGGMKQKLGLCCALIHDPDLLILDEPTTGVDPLSRRQFWQLIDDIRAERPGLTLITATAYMEEAARFDQLIAIDAGRLLASGPTPDVVAGAGAATLEEAFVALRHRAGLAGAAAERRALVLPPRPHRDGPPAIEASDLTCRFGDFTAVDRVSFRIEAGEIFGFLGSNGCGKTTTMKMLTGLLPATAGKASLLGQPVAAQDPLSRLNIGYMSQSFSLYEELSVHANLALHARLYQVPKAELQARIDDAVRRFDLADIVDRLPRDLSLGQRQRLQLAAACLHRPKVLILDEPTSGVDPEARDAFWRQIGQLSREDGVTIFISTHFMNEAARCDRISFMHRGRTLAVGTPTELAARHGDGDLENAFVHLIEMAEGIGRQAQAPATAAKTDAPVVARANALRRIGVFARREMLELRRDPIRLAFALLAPLFLMICFGFGMSFDVEHLRYAALDRDRSLESRTLMEGFGGSAYFTEMPAIQDFNALDQRLRSGDVQVAVEVPPNFGRDLLQGRKPQLGVFIDGSFPFRGETARGYVQGIALKQAMERARQTIGKFADPTPYKLEPRFRYNQDFKSVVAIVPGIMMLLLVLIPAMLTALGVVREKELGTIANLYASPAGIGEYLIGKQLPYIGVGCIAFALMTLVAIPVFGIYPKGSIPALILAVVLYQVATTGYGLLISAFCNSQVAALFAASILSIIPAVNFSGLLYPTATLEGAAKWIGLCFPASWYQTVSLGVFTKGLGFASFTKEFLALAAFGVAFLILARLCVSKQER